MVNTLSGTILRCAHRSEPPAIISRLVVTRLIGGHLDERVVHVLPAPDLPGDSDVLPWIDRLVAYGAVTWPRLRASWRR
jgi:hypothetical protein